MSVAIIRYKSLDFLGFPNYRVGDDGSVWSLHRRGGRTSAQTESEVHKMRGNGIPLKEIAKKLGIQYQLVWSILHRNPQNEVWKKLKCYGTSYPVADLRYGGKSRVYGVHQLVLLAFVGPCPAGMECRHFPDPDRKNCRLDNLQWGTRKENAADRKYHGVARGGSSRGEDNCKAVLNSQDVLDIRSMFDSGGCSLQDIHQKYSQVSLYTISDVVKRRSWRHL